MNQSIWNFWFVFGILITAASVCILINQVVLHFRCTEKTKGLIVQGDFHKRESALMLIFTVEGEGYRLPFAYSDKISVGDIVTVVYNPLKINRYSCYILEDVSHTRKVAIICAIGGIVSMLAGYGVHVGWFIETRYF